MWKDVLRAREWIRKKDVWKFIQNKRKVNKCPYPDLSGSRKLFWKEESKENVEKLENCSRMKDKATKLSKGEDDGLKTQKDYFKELWNVYNEEQIIVIIRCFEGAKGDDYFWGEQVSEAEVEARVKILEW